jgi:hypothetical protein
LTPQLCQTLISCAEDFHARASQTQENEKASMMPEVPCSLNWPDWLKPDDLRICCLKTSQDCYRMTKAGHLLPSSPHFMDWGMVWNGWYLTAKTSAHPNPGGGCTLSDILIPDAPEKYFLSPAQVERLLYKSSAAAKAPESMMPEVQHAP